jgi:hypothetical protein
MTSLRKRLSLTITAAALAIGTLGATAPTAAATVYVAGGSASTSIACSTSMQWVRQTISIRPQTGFSSQYVAFRSFFQPTVGTGAWTAWKTVTAPFYSTIVTPLGGMNLKIYMQYAFWNGSTWTYAGEWITNYTQVYGTAQYSSSYCAV